MSGDNEMRPVEALAMMLNSEEQKRAAAIHAVAEAANGMVLGNTRSH